MTDGPREWLYGLTADEWLHLASENEDSEVAPCCGNISDIREQLQMLTTLQHPAEWGWRKAIGGRLLELLEGDGEGHELQDREKFPLLHRVLDGVRAESATSIRRVQ